MKKYKIFILAIVALILAFSCFTGFVSAPSALAQPFDTLFPPQSNDYLYFYLDFTSCGISSIILEDTFVFMSYLGTVPDFGELYLYDGQPLSDVSSVSLVYLLQLPKSVFLELDVSILTLGFLFPDLTSYGIPSIDTVVFRDNQDVTFEPTFSYGSNFVTLPIHSSQIDPFSISSLVLTFANTELDLSNQFNTLRTQYNSLNSQYSTLQGEYDTLNTQYTTLQGQYNFLDTQYLTLQSDYNTLDVQYQLSQAELEEALELAETYQRDLREVTAQNERLQELVNNLPPTDLAFGWVGTAFATLDNILSIEIVPNISIGSLVLIPLILGVLFFVLRLVRGE